MNTASEIISYADEHNIHLTARGGQLVLNATKEALTDEFLSTAKQHKAEILNVITERWNPEMADEGYVWCLDCKHFDDVNCNHTENPFRTVTKQPLAPRKCQWYGEGLLNDN